MATVTLRPAGVAAIERGLHRGIHDGLAPFVLEEAQRLAPVGDPATDPHSGRLRDSGHIVEGDRGEVLVVFDAPEALFNEFGTSRMAAQPFMTPAAIAGAAHAGQLIAGPMREELR